MEAGVLLLSLQLAAALLGLAMGVALGAYICQAVCRRRLLNALFAADDQRRTTLLMRRGCAFLRPLARRLLRIPLVDEFVSRMLHVIDERVNAEDKAPSAASKKEAVLSLLIAVALGAGLVSGVVSSSAICGVAVGCCAIIGVVSYVRTQRDKEGVAMRENVPNALRSMITCFRSGLSLVQTLRHVSFEMGDALGDLFGVAARRLEMGASSTEALAVLHGQKRVPELVFVAVALDVQHQSGGSIAPVLEAARESVEGELDLMRSLRVQTAQAKLSSRIVTLMPFVLVALFSLMSPGFMEPFFSSVLGVCLLTLALSMQVAGILSVRHILKVEAG